MHIKKINLVLFSILLNMVIHLTVFGGFFTRNFGPTFKGTSNFSKIPQPGPDFNNIDKVCMENIMGGDHFVNIFGNEEVTENIFTALFKAFSSSSIQLSDLNWKEITNIFQDRLKLVCKNEVTNSDKTTNENNKTFIEVVKENPGKTTAIVGLAALWIGKVVRDHKRAKAAKEVREASQKRKEKLKNTQKELKKLEGKLDEKKKSFDKNSTTSNEKIKNINKQVDHRDQKNKTIMQNLDHLKDQYKNTSKNQQKLNKILKNNTNDLSNDLKENGNSINQARIGTKDAAPVIKNYQTDLEAIKKQRKNMQNNFKRLGVNTQENIEIKKLKARNNTLKESLSKLQNLINNQ